MFHDIAKGRGGDHFGSRHAGCAQRFCATHGVSAEDTALVVWLVEHHLTMSSGGAEEGSVRSRRDRRLRSSGRQRAPTDGTVFVDRRRYSRHQPESLECVEGQAARGPVLVGAPLFVGDTDPTGSRLQSRQKLAWRSCGCMRCPKACRRALVASWTRTISCATTRARSPGTRACCIRGSTARRRGPRALIADRRRRAGVDLYARSQESVRADLQLLRAHRLFHRRSEDLHHAGRICDGHVPGHGSGQGEHALPRCAVLHRARAALQLEQDGPLPPP